MADIITVRALDKRYASGQSALSNIDLTIARGELFALLGPNGAGKTTLISIICGLVTPTAGGVNVDGHDIVTDYRAARAKIGLVPQELTTDAFETVFKTVSFSRGLFGKPRDDAHIEQVLRDLSLWDKRNNRVMELSGGMKRRLLIAKALSHEPEILFLDEPTAGVDVELRRDMWGLVGRLRDAGVTIILTTHYIEEAEAMADRIGVIRRGELIVVEDKKTLMQRMGRQELRIELRERLSALPKALADDAITLEAGGRELVYTYNARETDTGVAELLGRLGKLGIDYKNLRTKQSSLEEIFVSLVHEDTGHEDAA